MIRTDGIPTVANYGSEIDRLPVTTGPDFTVRDEGSILLLTPVSEGAESWCDEYLGEDVLTWGKAIAVDHRCFPPIIEAILEEGYVVVA